MDTPVSVPVRILPPPHAKQCPACRHARPGPKGDDYCTVGMAGDEVYVLRGACPRYQEAPQ